MGDKVDMSLDDIIANDRKTSQYLKISLNKRNPDWKQVLGSGPSKRNFA